MDTEDSLAHFSFDISAPFNFSLSSNGLYPFNGFQRFRYGTIDEDDVQLQLVKSTAQECIENLKLRL